MIMKCDGNPTDCSRIDIASARPNRNAPIATLYGSASPKKITAIAMNPRPAVMFSVNMQSAPRERWAPAKPHRAPLISMEISLIRSGSTPSEAAACGVSPTARILRPNLVL
jgi:hypothetical protein